MKLSISLPESMAAEVKQLAKQTERPISWWLQRAWMIARKDLFAKKKPQYSAEKLRRKLEKITGSLKDAYPDIDSVTLAKRAFENID